MLMNNRHPDRGTDLHYFVDILRYRRYSCSRTCNSSTLDQLSHLDFFAPVPFWRFHLSLIYFNRLCPRIRLPEQQS